MVRLARLGFTWLLLATGCDISAKSFSGTVVNLTLTGVQTAPGAHLELWARSQFNDIIRINGNFDIPDPKNPQITNRITPYGYKVVPAITMGDPCMIDANGNLLVTASAYKDGDFGGVHETAEEQAQQVRGRIQQLTALSDCDGSGLDPTYHCGHQAGVIGTLQGLIAYQLVDAAGNVTSQWSPPPAVPFDAPPQERLAACTAYWASSPLAYTPNPAQITGPVHGVLWGVLTYTTTLPPSLFDAIRVDSPVHLKGLRELWFTTETNDQVDPENRGPVLIQGTPGIGGRAVVHIEMLPPPDPTGMGMTASVAGSAALYVDLDEDPIQF